MNHQLTKSKYCHGQICPKRLWLLKNKPDAESPLTDFDKFNSEQGNEIELAAQQLYPDGICVSDKTQSTEQNLQKTKEHIQLKTKTLFQPAFYAHKVLVYCDILDRQKDDSYHLVEVKSFSDISDKVKIKEHNNFYINDLLIQSYVLKENGLNITRASILYLNKDYIRGNTLDYHALFQYYDLPQDILDNLDNIPQKVEQLINFMESKIEVEREMGSHCGKPQDCSFKKYCLSLLPDDSLRKTSFFAWQTRDFFINRNQTTLSSLNLSDPKLQKYLPGIQAELDNKIIIDKSALNDFLNKFVYPLYFLDFEAAPIAIPRYENLRPYQKIPFQFSLHIKKNMHSEFEHHEFLWAQDSDPTAACAQALCEYIGPKGSIIAYHKAYENSVLKEIAERSLAFNMQLLDMASRLIDLEDPFTKQICCIPKSMGYSSIKKILPLLCSGFNYDELEIKSGDTAIVKYWQLIHSLDESERQKIISELKQYCHQDTLAMVKIYEALKNMASHFNF